jgi:hypothetical protein
MSEYPHRGGWRHASWCSFERGEETECTCGLDDARRSLALPSAPDHRLREALERAYHDLLAYGQHMTGEVSVRLWDDEKVTGHRLPGEPCKCGLDTALMALETALKDR